MLGRHRQLGAWGQVCIGVEHRAEGRHGRGFALERARGRAHLLAFAGDYRQGRAIVMAEGGPGLLCGHRQRHPCLKAEQTAAAATRFGSAQNGPRPGRRSSS